MTNIQIAEQLHYIALLLEYLEGPSFPVRRFNEMAQMISRFDFPARLFRAHGGLQKIHALFFPKARTEQMEVLRGLLDEEFHPAPPAYTQKTGLAHHSLLPLITMLEKEVPPETVELIRLPEMGAYRAALLRDILGIKTVSVLQDACRRHLIRKQEEFDADLEKRWSLGKWYSSSQRNEFPPQSRLTAEPFVSFILGQLKQFTAVFPETVYPTPWEQFSSLSSPENAPSSGQPPFRQNQWDTPIIPIPNVRLRRSLGERIRALFTRSEPTAFPHRPFFAPNSAASERGPHPNSVSIPPLLLSVEPAGEFRRLEEAVHTFDFLITTPNIPLLFDQISALSFLKITERRDSELDAAVGRGQLVWSDDHALPGASIRFFAVPPHSRTAKSVYLSSAPAHWQELTRRAGQAGLTLDETGLFREKTEIQLNSDADLYKALELPALPPETRNGLFEFGLTPSLLIRREQMRGDLHLHSVFTDGTGTLEQMADKAIASGLDYIAMTDHSKRVAVANGMDEKRILAYWDAIDALNEDIREHGIPFRVLKGVEVDILGTAVLDFSDDILSQAEWVQASLHFEQGQARDQIHRRLMAAFTSPYVSAISHPTGKTWQSDFRIDMDTNFLFEMAKQYGKCLELNSQPRRFDLDWHLCRKAKEHGVKIVISTDSHAPEEMDYLSYGVQLARKAGLTADDIINTLPVDAILALRTSNTSGR